MVDGKTVGTQVQELQLIFHDLIAKGMVVNEAFQVAAMIEKLPPSWKDFKHYLKHKRKEMKLEDLVIRLKIEEDNKTAEKRYRKSSSIEGANVVEDAAPKKNRKGRGLLERRRFLTRKNSRATVIIVVKQAIKLPTVVPPRRTKRKTRVRQTWWKMLMTCVQCCLSATWLVTQMSGGLILAPLDMCVPLRKHLQPTLPLDPKRS
ncbi:uncharacterized protein LOC132598597 [Lycium barbarum]|uniref:uncharacterized protein LOC132598597 n=1 Tax=Lycium barbarum TaxID=112863 RepID=UPI00293EAB1D|nr:uncharacterized protein LOC132598597 [Lycium barbarum]